MKRFLLYLMLLVTQVTGLTAVHAATKEAYAVLSTDQTTLSFYYDTNKSSRSGTVYTAANFRKSYDGSSWGAYRSNITKVVFDSSFANYTGLTSTRFWFYGCSKTTTISGIENLNTQNVTDMSAMFSGCSSLTSLDLSSFNTQNVTNMYAMFSGCSSLTSLDLSSFNTQNVTDMSAMFYGCSSLTSLDLSSFNTQNVTDMQGMFYGCSSLTSLDLSSFNTQNVTDMSWMFYGCSSLKTIVVGGEWSTTNVTNSHEMFSGCTSLVGGDGTKYNLNYMDKTKAYAGQGGYLTLKSAATKEAYAVLSTDKTTLSFYYDTNKSSRSGTVYTAANFRKNYTDSSWGAYRSNITKVVFDSSFANYTGLTSTAYWFYGCSKITTISGIENLKTQNVTDMRWMFNGCSSLTSLNLSSFNTQNVTDMFDMFYGCSSLTSLNLSSFNTQNVTNMYAMFYGCSSLTSLNLSSFNTQNVTNMSEMFRGCSSLTSLNLSSFNTQNVTRMYYMFYGCSSLTSLNLSSFNTQNVTDMSFMFYGCSSLTSLNLSSFNTQNVTDMRWMFYGCSSLTSLNLSSFNTQNVTSMGSMFYGCSSLTSLNLSSFNTQNVTNMSEMFLGCSSLTSLNLSSFNTQNVTYMGYMFYDCSSLKTIVVGGEWSTTNVTYSTQMFYGCTSLVGGDGTKYNSSYMDKTKAYAGQGGYLTLKGAGTKEAYAVLSTDKTTLSFYYDTNKGSRSGTVYTAANFRKSSDGSWGAYSSNITKVVFDSSFANYTGLTSTACWFSGCSNLTTISGIANLKTQNVTNMSVMFDGCSSLTSLDLSSFNTQNVTDMGYMFYGCSSLKTIVVGGEWSTTNVTSSKNMFAGCTSLVGGDGTEFNSSYIDKTKAYAGQGGYLTLKDAGTKEAYAVLSTDKTTLSFYYDTNKSSRSGTVYTAANFRKSDLDSWGAYRWNITKVVFDNSFANYTGLTSTACWFQVCNKLTTISGIENLNTQNVTDMYFMFDLCSSLTSLNLSSFNTQNVTNMYAMFSGCSSLTSLNLSSFNTQNVTDMGNMFVGCSSLTSLNLSSFNTQNVTYMYDMFRGCSSLTSLDLSSFNTQNVTYMESMFSGCSSLKTIVVGGEWSTTNVTKSHEMFSGCTSLVGGDGTKYNSSYMDKTKAYAGQGGYLTLKGAGTGTDTRTYNGQTWMIGNYPPIRYDFASINDAMESSMVKDGDILMVDHFDLGDAQTVNKSVKIVSNKYGVYGQGFYGDLNIEAPNVTVDGLHVYGANVNVRDENARIEHCSILGNIVAGDNYECDCAFINSNRVGTAIDAGSAYDWTITNNYINGTFSGDLSEYSNYPIDMPYFSEFSLPSTGTANSTIALKYIITNVSSINYMEYFWDTDPGWAKGTPLKNANNNYVINAWNEPLNISTAGLSTGSHTLVIRARSGSGYWVTAVNSVTIQSAPVTNPKPVFSTYQFPTSGYNNNYAISFSVAAEGGLIDWVEYFWDTDPGEKRGTSIVDVGHDSGSGITRSSYAINCQGLTGKHTLYLRAFCGTESTTVYVKEINLSAPPVVDDRINANDLAALKLISDNLGLNGYWNFANEGRLEGDFPGVTFVNHRVTEINLSNHAFGGTLSESWMPSLPEITLLNLSRNNIYGDLTPLVYRMPKLKTLDVSHNRILQISGPLPASITSLNVKSQMRVFSNNSSGSYESIVLVLPSGMSSATAKLGANVSLTLPSLFNYNASRNDNSLRADIQVVNTSQPSTVYGTYSYNGEGKGWKFTPIQTSSMSFADKTNVAIVTMGTAQQFSAYPAQLSVVLGDANIDGDVDVLDVQHTLNYILATAQPFNYWAANTYVDQRINVQDIVCTVNIMLGLPNNVRQGSLARSITYNGNPESSETQCWVYEENSRIAIAPTTDVAAVDIEIEGACTDEVSLLLNHKQFQMIGQNTATGSRYVIFSPTGNTIPAEKVSALLALSHSAQPVAVRCADVKAREVVTTIGQTTGITEVTPRYGEQTVIETRLAPGVYIVRTVGTNGESKTVKIIKK